jgi:ParB-like chromosome segregation protein Spo0J
MSAQVPESKASPTLPPVSPAQEGPPRVARPSPKITSVDQPPSALKPWPNNPRQHSPKQFFKLKKSISYYGFTIPILVDEAGTILAGEARWRVAKELSLATIPTRVISGLSQAEKRSYVISDNKTALLSSWDPDLLRDEIQLLIDEDFEIDLTGFDTVEIDLILESADDADLDLQLADLGEAVVSRRGDRWQLGKHRLLCGDALSVASYAALLGSDKAQMAITDPPYNVKIDGHAGGLGKIKHKEFPMACGEMSSPAFVNFLSSACNHLVTYTDPGAICFVFMDWRHQQELLQAAQPAFGPPKQMCVWVKDNAGMGSFYRSQHELVYAFKNGSAPHINNFELGQGGRYRTNVWEYPGINSGHGRKLLKLHPTVKPAAMITDAIRDCSHRDGLILDPFAGSGTVLVAAERTGRRARAIELDPQYVDVGIRRWQRVSGQQAVLAATGQTWEEVRAERLQATDLPLLAEASHGL